MASEDPVAPYERGLQEFAARFEGVDFADVHVVAASYIPVTPGLVLDVGAGTGRDAAWFAGRGWEVVAVEPARGFRALGRGIHPSERIRWEDDRLPGLERVHRLGLTFDLLWLSAVWMHVPPGERSRAMRKLVTLLKPGGRIIVSLRLGPAPIDRPMHPVSVEELERLAAEHGLSIRAVRDDIDRHGRGEISWRLVVLDLPDDGTGAMPLVRGFILRDQKAATYKLALLRAIARAADQAGALGLHEGDHVVLPLGLLALYWIRMFKPLVEGGLPQSPTDGTGRGLAFVKAPFRALRGLAPFDLRPGQALSGDLAAALAAALGDAAYTIARMPAHYLTHADGCPVFPTEYLGRARVSGARLVIEPALLWAYGSTRVPVHLWTTFRRLAVWIEPMLLAEWTRLVEGYAERQGRQVTTDAIHRALRWLDPERDTAFVRTLARRRHEAGQSIYCVWSQRRLSPETLDIDHCLPWSAWPCGDLWNLLPAARDVNQHSKRERLVTATTLHQARDLIQEWYASAYLSAGEPIRRRFHEEARSSLPLCEGAEAGNLLDEVFAGLDYQRLRIGQDQQLEEWQGLRS